LAGAALTAAVVTVGAAATALLLLLLGRRRLLLSLLGGRLLRTPIFALLVISAHNLLLEARNKLGGASARVGRGLIRELLNVRLLRAVNPEKQRKRPSDEALSSLEIARISVDSPHDRLIVRAEGAPRRAVLMASNMKAPSRTQKEDGRP